MRRPKLKRLAAYIPLAVLLTALRTHVCEGRLTCSYLLADNWEPCVPVRWLCSRFYSGASVTGVLSRRVIPAVWCRDQGSEGRTSFQGTLSQRGSVSRISYCTDLLARRQTLGRQCASKHVAGCAGRTRTPDKSLRHSPELTYTALSPQFLRIFPRTSSMPALAIPTSRLKTLNLSRRPVCLRACRHPTLFWGEAVALCGALRTGEGPRLPAGTGAMAGAGERRGQSETPTPPRSSFYIEL